MKSSVSISIVWCMSDLAGVSQGGARALGPLAVPTARSLGHTG